MSRDWKREYGMPPNLPRGQVGLRYDNDEFYGACLVLYRDHGHIRVGWIIDFEPPWEAWGKALVGDRTRYVAMLCDGQCRSFDDLQEAEDWVIPKAEDLVARLNASPLPEEA